MAFTLLPNRVVGRLLSIAGLEGLLLRTHRPNTSWGFIRIWVLPRNCLQWEEGEKGYPFPGTGGWQDPIYLKYDEVVPRGSQIE
uniref:Uncharacterized protein n=1 Tax=Hyaloperonospora arabidopsidis (strain Emoy2) TaxID=559515 RepID=M4BAP2_HYAAE